MLNFINAIHKINEKEFFLRIIYCSISFVFFLNTRIHFNHLKKKIYFFNIKKKITLLKNKLID